MTKSSRKLDGETGSQPLVVRRKLHPGRESVREPEAGEPEAADKPESPPSSPPTEGSRIRRRKKRKEHTPQWESGKHRSGQTNKLLARGGLMMGAATMLAIVACVVVWVGKQPQSQGSSSEFRESRVKRLKWISPGKEDAVLKARSAIELRDPSQWQDYFHPSSHEPGEGIEFLQHMAEDMGDGITLQWVGDIGRGEQALTGVLITPGYRSSRMRLALLTPDERGVWKLNFDALACTSSPDWETIADGEVTTAVVRTVLTPDHYYNGPYREERWICYRLASLNSETALYGYCQRGSAQHFALEKILSRSRRASATATTGPDASAPESAAGQQAESDTGSHHAEQPAAAPPMAGQHQGPGHRAILRLRRSPEAIGRQFEITRILASDWVMDDQPYDRHFAGVRELYDVRAPLD